MQANDYRSKRIVITGGAGFLASAIVRALGDTDCHIVRADRAGSRFPATAGAPRIEDVRCDVRQTETWDRISDGADVIFHLAAQTSAQAAFLDPLPDLQVNQTAMLHLLETCRRTNRHPRLIFAGTVTECGIPESLPVGESHPDRPVTIYDVHKWAAEQYLRQYVRAGLVHGAVLRLANVYGPGPRSGSGDRGVLNAMIRKALAGESLTIYGDGAYVRDYVFVDDVARAFLAAGSGGQETGERTDGRSFVIGSGAGHTIAEAVHLVAERVAAKTGMESAVVHVPPPSALLPIERRNFVADSSAFSAAAGWRPIVSLAQGIDLTIDALLSEASPRAIESVP